MSILKKSKITELDDVKEYLKSIPSLHYGGCGIAALAIKRWLKKHKNIDSHIIYGFTNKHDYYRPNAIAIEKNDLNAVSSCSHAGVCINGETTIFDVKTVWSKDEFPYYLTMPEEFVVPSLNVNRWNSCFDRSHIKDIANKLKIDLSDVKLRVDD